MARELLDVERMNELMNAATSGASIDEACETDEERSFYLELEAANERLKAEGHGREPIGEWP